MRPTAEELRQLWGLTKLPQEDVLFTQTYESAGRSPDGKPLCNAMVAMFTDEPGSFSDMHRLPTDELWHFYLGDPIELLLLHPDGSDELVILGTDVLNGQRVQAVVPSGTWMGARLRPGGEYGVYGNSMAPGFVPDDFEPADHAHLVTRWPHRRDLVTALTRT
ncbi:cupin domain-containing protein [Actinophytocola oryzae]|nr:cupin domain-containing protein [Actinophytocola oryzae]